MKRLLLLVFLLAAGYSLVDDSGKLPTPTFHFVYMTGVIVIPLLVYAALSKFTGLPPVIGSIVLTPLLILAIVLVIFLAKCEVPGRRPSYIHVGAVEARGDLPVRG